MCCHAIVGSSIIDDNVPPRIPIRDGHISKSLYWPLQPGVVVSDIYITYRASSLTFWMCRRSCTNFWRCILIFSRLLIHSPHVHVFTFVLYFGCSLPYSWRLSWFRPTFHPMQGQMENHSALIEVWGGWHRVELIINFRKCCQMCPYVYDSAFWQLHAKVE